MNEIIDIVTIGIVPLLIVYFSWSLWDTMRATRKKEAREAELLNAYEAWAINPCRDTEEALSAALGEDIYGRKI